MEQWNSDFTINVLLCATALWEVWFICRWETKSNDWTFHFMFRNSSTISFAFYADDLDSTYTFQANKWYNLVWTYNRSSKSMKIYVNWTLIWSKTSSWYPNFWSSNVFLWKRNYSVSAEAIPFNWIQAQFIAENKEWNQQEITDYWNYISEKYGLS